MRPKSTSEIRSTGSRTRLLAGSSFLAVIEYASFGRMSVIGRDLLHGQVYSGRVVCRKNVTMSSSGGPNHPVKNAAKVFGSIERAECPINC